MKVKPKGQVDKGSRKRDPRLMCALCLASRGSGPAHHPIYSQHNAPEQALRTSSDVNKCANLISC